MIHPGTCSLQRFSAFSKCRLLNVFAPLLLNRPEKWELRVHQLMDQKVEYPKSFSTVPVLFWYCLLEFAKNETDGLLLYFLSSTTLSGCTMNN